MIQKLFGGGSGEQLEAAQGRTIAALRIDPEGNGGDGVLQLEFAGGVLTIRDAGRSCCESRYMTTDDALAAHVGAVFLGVEVRDGPESTDDEPHEQQFLLVNTSAGTFTVVTHNEHNGYYGGFWLEATFDEADA
jgi:hypothetical protein